MSEFNPYEPQKTYSIPEEKRIYCWGCGSPLHESAKSCPNCGAVVKEFNLKQHERLIMAVLAFIFGGFGLHRFYMGQIGKGILYLILLPIFGISVFLGIIDSIRYLLMSDTEFENYKNKR